MSDTLWNQLPAARMSCDCSAQHIRIAHKIDCLNSENCVCERPVDSTFCSVHRFCRWRRWWLNICKKGQVPCSRQRFTTVWIRSVCVHRHAEHYSHIILSSKCHWRKMEYLSTRSLSSHIGFLPQQHSGKWRARTVGESLSFDALHCDRYPNSAAHE